MKVKVIRRKKPAPAADEQVEVVCSIELLRDLIPKCVSEQFLFGHSDKEIAGLILKHIKNNQRHLKPTDPTRANKPCASKECNGMKISNIINSEKPGFENFDGRILTKPVFKQEEKERASKISEHLKGLTVFEARELLEKLSNAIALAADLEKIE